MNNPNYKRSSLNLTRNNEPNQFSINPINTYSLKPISLIIPQDINVKEILKNVMKKINFGGDKFYQYKKLTQSEITNRKTMIESMKKFLIENRIKCSVLYSTIFLFDILINKNKNKELSYEELALGALILSVKFSNEHNLFKSNKKNIFLNNNEYSFSESAEIEIICIDAGSTDGTLEILREYEKNNPLRLPPPHQQFLRQRNARRKARGTRAGTGHRIHRHHRPL